VTFASSDSPHIGQPKKYDGFPAEAEMADGTEETLRIAMLSPPWIPVPPGGYGGIEVVIDLLCAELVRTGHDVTLFAAPGSESPANVETVLEEAQPNLIGEVLFEVDHVATAFDLIDQAEQEGDPFDIVHDHCSFAGLAMADRLSTPLLHTIHCAIRGHIFDFYSRHGHKAPIVGISHHQLSQGPKELCDPRVIGNPIDLTDWPFEREKDNYLLWVGRMTEGKGPHRAIAAARQANMPLILAGIVQPGEESFFTSEVAPFIDDDRVRFIGEVTGNEKAQLFANARALLMPVRWPEPFGMVMIEALSAGTPVIAFPEGSTSEIIIDGLNGFLVHDEEQLVESLSRIGEIDPESCRESARERYDVTRVTSQYLSAYKAAIALKRRQLASA
jgi:glycosyltransferase involved in cell wall biosynthesis